MTTKNFLNFFILITLTSMLSCSSQECRFCNEKQQGAVFQNIRSKADTSVFYNIYVPANTKNNKLPALIFFDAHGNTAPAIKKYTTLADKYSIMLVGFNASENGMPFENIWGAFNSWIPELYKTAPVDSNSLFLVGFSGGARVVSLIENKMPNVLATALCCAGPSDIELWLSKATPSMLFTGTGDFNYFEINSLKNNTNVPRTFNINVYQGSHEWPPVEAFEDFFVLMSRLTNKSFNCEEKYCKDRAINYSKNGRPDLAFYSVSSAIFSLGNKASANLLSFADSLKTIIPVSFTEEINLCANEEYSLNKRIGFMFQNADTTSFFALMDSIDSKIQIESYSVKADAFQRVKAWGGIAAYSFSKKAREMDVPFLFSILRMYEYIEPDNTDMLVLMSAYYAKNNDCIKAKQYLKTAKRKGFNNNKQLKSMKEFDNCEGILD